ncbi:peptidylprolyl isomerase [Cyanobacterium aponinum AL20118]|uniref:peptidylprolyl isomerase n=1 Tax=Cyanobacterium aponinum AL20115 TaxID=3090662 RepID=A0AAF0ZA04_9CHRO|nr:peptidylprolyl isomerase [Cyanobacterium aponinum]WPF89161.1 peptidylprolyl isomerase [Cyanobacterium aponinum AL20115]WRL37513.1 peptidylprolyl isomerase [Cyanobacterium aponinum UTEX 3221]
MKLNWWKRLLKNAITKWRCAIATLLIAIITIINPVGLHPAQAILAQGDAITDPEAILRYALPIDNDIIRQIQGDIEKISRNLRAKRWAPVEKEVRNAAFLLKLHQDDLVQSVPEELQPKAKELVTAITEDVAKLQELVEKQDKEQVYLTRARILDNITELEEDMVTGYPFTVPEEYANLPQLLGRATVEVETTQGNLTIVVDGYSAPVTGGNFVDLVERKFYDGLPFIRAEDYYVLQTGDPEGEEVGFIDPDTNKYRAIPLEVLVKGESEPLYGFTTEDVGMYLAQPVLPFNAYGAVALARPSTDPNGGSSQFFFFKFDTEVTPPGYNLMDGRFAVFGYVTEGADVLEKLTAEDKIISAHVIEGKENLVKPQQS